MRHTKSATLYILSVMILLLSSGCARKLGVVRVGLEKRFAQLSRNALIAPDTSERTFLFLYEHDLLEEWEKDPVALIRKLDWQLLEQEDRELLFALMEMSYLTGKQYEKDPEMVAQLYLSCAVYAYAYLFDPSFGDPPSQYHPHSRLACDFYNRGLAKLLLNYRERGINADDVSQYPLINGYMEQDEMLSELDWDPSEFTEFYIANEYEVKGLEDYHGSYGMGVPIIAIRTPPDINDIRKEERYLPRVSQTYPVTVFLRLTREGLASEATNLHCRGTFELYNPFKTKWIMIDSTSVPLETDFTTPLAHMISTTKIPSGFEGMLDVDSWKDRQGLHMLEPYDPEKIPVVFVHGLMSSPFTWLKMLNTLKGDPKIHEKYQFWFFMYPTGNPVLYSAANLRDSLDEMYRAFSDDAAADTLDRMVLVGHSMGGLLSKLMVKPSSNLFWRSEVNKPYTSLTLSPQTREFIERIFFFKPLPFVKRVIFIAAPHRGSVIASGMVGRIGSSLIKLPAEYADQVQEALDELVEDDDLEEMDALADIRLDTGIDNLAPGHPIHKISNSIPFPSNVTYHSIIGNKMKAGEPDGTDGVVPYASSHLDGSQTEIIVKSGHNAHTHPGAIKEVKRILLEHYNTTE